MERIGVLYANTLSWTMNVIRHGITQTSITYQLCCEEIQSTGSQVKKYNTIGVRLFFFFFDKLLSDLAN